jgi:hypothetical protein
VDTGIGLLEILASPKLNAECIDIVTDGGGGRMLTVPFRHVKNSRLDFLDIPALHLRGPANPFSNLLDGACSMEWSVGNVVNGHAVPGQPYTA